MEEETKEDLTIDSETEAVSTEIQEPKKSSRKEKKEQKKQEKKEKKAKKKEEKAEKKANKESKPKKKIKVNKKNLSILGIFLLSCIVLFFVFYFVFVPKLTLLGKSVVNVEYGSKYKEPGYKASYMGGDITDHVWIVGKVDNEKLGTYVLKYKIQKNKITTTKQRVVNVVDTKKPEIILEGEIETKICPNKTYEEEGFKAIDNYDGEITDKVKSTPEDDKVTYEVKDSSGNKESVVRTLVREDAEAPKINLSGSSTMYVVINNKYNEPGFTATDNCEGDLTSKVKVEGNVNTSSLGTYTLTYSVADSKNNVATEKRTVIVQQNYTRLASNYTCGKAGVIYLTFDDGPNPYYTPKVLDVLKKYNVKATFFVLGSKVNSYQDLIKREVNEGHAVGIHTWSHDYAQVYKSSDAFWSEVTRTHDAIKNVSGYDTKLIRFPGGASNTVSRHYSTGIMKRLTNEVLSKGYNYFDWNISSGDAGGTTDPNVEYRNVVNSLSKSRGNVVLMHDIKNHTANAIESIVKYGIDNGYTFAVIDSSVICRQGTNN